MRKQCFDRQRRRQLSLGTGEFVSAGVFIALGFGLAPPWDTANRAIWTALASLILVLIQAGSYWLLCLGRRPPDRLSSREAQIFRALKIFDAGLLAAALAVIGLNWPDRTSLGVIALFIWAFAAVEFLNYFIVRLAYPGGQWFREAPRRREPRLARDIRIALMR